MKIPGVWFGKISKGLLFDIDDAKLHRIVKGLKAIFKIDTRAYAFRSYDPEKLLLSLSGEIFRGGPISFPYGLIRFIKKHTFACFFTFFDPFKGQYTPNANSFFFFPTLKQISARSVQQSRKGRYMVVIHVSALILPL